MLGLAVTRFVLLPVSLSYPLVNGGRLHLRKKREKKFVITKFVNYSYIVDYLEIETLDS